MKAQIERNEKPQEINFLKIFIGDNIYRISEIDNGFIVNKISDGEVDTITITPNVRNQIQIN